MINKRLYTATPFNSVTFNFEPIASTVFHYLTFSLLSLFLYFFPLPGSPDNSKFGTETFIALFCDNSAVMIFVQAKCPCGFSDWVFVLVICESIRILAGYFFL